jgi:uncharacterized protein YndB with AHSA1/START domain
MSVNRDAPVVAAGEIEITADADKVWEVMTGVEKWPTWNPDVEEASLSGDVAEGTEFRWKVRTGMINSTFKQVERPRLLAWTGKGFGVNAVHIWRLEPRDGSTLVGTEESSEALLARILRGPFQKALKQSIDSGLMYLKTEVERTKQAR